MNKKLLVLGGTYASLDVVKVAKSEGIYTIVTDYLDDGVAKRLADETAKISTTDIDELAKLIKEKNIDGVFCGPSEFNLVNAMQVANKAGLRYYFNEKQWEQCSDKALFKDMCRKYGVPCVPEYNIDLNNWEESIKNIQYPVIVKPVDSSSSRGISVCKSANELKIAYDYALSFSQKKKVIVEKYISNDKALAVRYIIYKGKAHLLLVNDRYTVGEKGTTGMISGFAVYPSFQTESYIANINKNVCDMLESLNLDCGVAFLQALIDHEQIYFHEMGLRLSGGLTYKLTEPTTGISDLKMMINYMVGNNFANDEQINKIDPYLNGLLTGSLCVPLNPGKIQKIKGISIIKENPTVSDIVQYYYEGDTVAKEAIGTLDQHFCRIKFIVQNKKEMIEMIKFVNENLEILDEKNNSLIYKKFDIHRIK